MSMSYSTTPTFVQANGFSKLPPIITSEADRKFLTDLSEYVDKELQYVSTDDLEQRYVVHQTAFNKIIDYVTSYKPILSSIKKEYEDTIDAIKNGQREAVFLTGKLKAMSSEPSTMRNYRKRADQLEERIGIIQKDNEKLQAKLDTLRKSRQEQEKKDKEILEPAQKELKKDKRLLPGLTLEQSTDLSLLHSKLDKLDRQFKELTISFKTRYVPQARKEELKDALNAKVNQRDELFSLSKQNRARQERLEVAVAAAQEYNRYKPPHQTVGDAVSLALAKAAGEKLAALVEKAELLAQGGEVAADAREGSPTTTSTFDDDDPSKEKEAEMMLDYIEKFNELFEDGKYEEAAIHAANSPKGILRTPATLTKFKDIRGRVSGKTPLLSFCDALMSSVPAVGIRPNASLSVDCVQCALDENRLDLLSHWIAQDRLTVSVDIACLIQKYCKCKQQCKCSCQALAQNIYTTLGQHRDVILSMLKQSRIRAAVDYAAKKALFTRFDYTKLLETCPSVHLAQALVEQEQGLLPLGVIIRVLQFTDIEEDENRAMQFLTGLQTKPKDSTVGRLRDLVIADAETAAEEWVKVANDLEDQGYHDTALELLAASTIREVLQRSISFQ